MSNHRGEIVEKIVRDSKISISQIAKDIGYSRTQVYNFFKESELSLDIILAIGKSINYDFSEEIAAFSKIKSVTKHDKSYWETKFNERKVMYDELLEKYYGTLELCNNLLLEKLNRDIPGDSVVTTHIERTKTVTTKRPENDPEP